MFAEYSIPWRDIYSELSCPSQGPAPIRARQDSGSGGGGMSAGGQGAAAAGVAPAGLQVRQEPLFHSVPPRPQRLLHSEAYIKYIEVSRYIQYQYLRITTSSQLKCRD